MLQAITTKYLGATTNRNARVKATAQAGSVTVEWDSNLGTDANHMAAAKALAEKMGWIGNWQGGGNENGCVFVPLTDERDQFTAR